MRQLHMYIVQVHVCVLYLMYKYMFVYCTRQLHMYIVPVHVCVLYLMHPEPLHAGGILQCLRAGQQDTLDDTAEVSQVEQVV